MRASSPKAVVEKRSEANEASGVLGKGPVCSSYSTLGGYGGEGGSHLPKSHPFPPRPSRLPPALVDKVSTPTLTTLPL